MTPNPSERAGAPPSADHVLPQIPEVTLLGEIARGGMGVVYRGRQEFLARDVAVKLLAEHLQGPSFEQRFRREARLLAGIKHPHIVACHTAGTAGNGQSYLVMEFVDGPSLKRWIDDHGRVPLPAALRLLQKLASALAHAYDLGVIHRDVKPENVLLEAPTSTAIDLAFPFVPKLVDLGLARLAAQRGDLALTAPGAVMGTPATMAPEQFDAPDDVDFRADIYGLGGVLYQMLTGVAPFASTRLSDIVVEKRRPRGPDPCARVGDLPSGVGALVASMLACAPADRPADYRTLIARLDELASAAAAAASPSPARPAPGPAPLLPSAGQGRGGPDLLRTAEFEFLAAGGPIVRAAEEGSVPLPDPTGTLSRAQLPPPQAVAAAPRRPRRVGSLVGGVVVVAGALAAVPWVLQPGPDEPPPQSETRATSPTLAAVAPSRRRLAIELAGDVRPDAPIALRADLGELDPLAATCRWTVQPATAAQFSAPNATATELRLEGLPGDAFELELEVAAAGVAPVHARRALVLDYPPQDLFADFLERQSAWNNRPRARPDWRLDEHGGVFCLADDFPSLRSRPLTGAVWRLRGELRPEHGRRGYAQAAVCLRCGPAGQLAIVCTRDGAAGQNWSIALMTVDRDDGRAAFQLRPMPQPRQVVAVDEGDRLGSAGFTITRRGDELTFEFGFADGESERHREPLRAAVDNVQLTLLARGGRATFPKLELW